MARCNDLYDVKIIVRSSVKLLKEIKDLLKKNPTRQRLFRRTVFGPWLDILSHDNDNHLMHYVLHHQFGRKEFCLMTGFRFGKVSEKYSKLSPFCQRLFPEKITKKGVLNLKSIELLGVLRNTETWIGLSDMDAVRVCLLLVAELVFMGKEDRNCIPRHLVSLVEDFDCWNMYPWGEYMWVKFYQRTVNVAAKHREFHLVKKKQNPNYYPTYNLYGFPLSFKIWILETYPNSRKWWSKKDNVLPRALAWSNVAKFGKNDYNGLLGPDSNPKLKLYPTPLEQQTEWFKASIEFINGLVDLDMNVFEDDIGGDVSNNSFDLNENAISGNGNNDVPERCELTVNTSSTDSQMHNNIMAAGSKDRPPMLGPGRYSQWRSRFLRYIDTKPNGGGLKKCILNGPYVPTSVLIQAVPEAEGRPAVQQHTAIETVLNMTPENKEHFQSEKEAIFLLLTGIGDEIYSTVDACNTVNEMWIAIERLQQGESLNVQDVKTNLF
ncbi:phospholipase-like protein [Tanacetum coccineum]